MDTLGIYIAQPDNAAAQKVITKKPGDSWFEHGSWSPGLFAAACLVGDGAAYVLRFYAAMPLLAAACVIALLLLWREAVIALHDQRLNRGLSDRTIIDVPVTIMSIFEDQVRRYGAKVRKRRTAYAPYYSDIRPLLECVKQLGDTKRISEENREGLQKLIETRIAPLAQDYAHRQLQAAGKSPADIKLLNENVAQMLLAEGIAPLPSADESPSK
jgi:hypothetical protein